MNRRRFLAGVTATATVLVCLLRAQESAPPQFRTATDLVTVDVTVLDRNRRPIRGLTASDFTILDGGQRRPITGFTAIDLPPTTTTHVSTTGVDGVAPDVTSNAPADGRLVTIMFDHSIPSGWGSQAARRVARAIVEQLGPDDRAAIVFSDRALSQDFTNDRVKLMAIVDNPVIGTSLAEAQGVPRGSDPAYDPVSGSASDMADGWTVEQQRAQDSPIPSAESGNCYCGLCTLETITTVAESVGEVSTRRKVLFFIGGYLPLNPEAWGSKDSPCQPYLPPVIMRTLRAAQRANLAIYAFDPNGLMAPVQYSATARLEGLISPAGAGGQRSLRSTETLLAAAEQTGGRAIVNTNAPEERVVGVFEETGMYYLLGFEPPTNAAPGAFRNLTIRVNRPGARVITRRGYYVPARDDDAPTVPETDPMRNALDSLLPQTSMPMRLSLAPFPTADGTATALAVTTAVERDGAGAVELLAAAFDRTGRMVASVRHTVPPVAGSSVTGTDEIFTRLDLPQPGGYHVRVAAHDTVTGRIASVHDIADVPAFARDPLALSGLVVHTSRVLQRSIAAFTDFLPAVPTTRRTFAPGETVTIYAQVAQAAPATSVVMTARVFDASGTPRLERGSTIDPATFAAGPTFFLLDLPIGHLDAGAYLLNLEAVRGPDRVSRTMRFGIQESVVP